MKKQAGHRNVLFMCVCGVFFAPSLKLAPHHLITGEKKCQSLRWTLRSIKACPASWWMYMSMRGVRLNLQPPEMRAELHEAAETGGGESKQAKSYTRFAIMEEKRGEPLLFDPFYDGFIPGKYQSRFE